jgi:DNA-binding MarR family transcriptional regulator
VQVRAGARHAADTARRRRLRLSYTVNVTLTFSDESAGRAEHPEQPGRPERRERTHPTPAHDRGGRQLVADVLDELTGWSARDRVGEFRSWHRGALSLVHLNVLTVLEAEGPLPMSRLAEELDVSDASATGIVDRMERRVLVERRHGTEDRRIVVVHLTDQGSAVFRDIEEQRRERLARLLEELTEDELAGFLAGVRALHGAHARVSRHGSDR